MLTKLPSIEAAAAPSRSRAPLIIPGILGSSRLPCSPLESYASDSIYFSKKIVIGLFFFVLLDLRDVVVAVAVMAACGLRLKLLKLRLSPSRFVLLLPQRQLLG